MQNVHKNILTSTEKLSAFHKKIILWKKRVEENNLSMFPFVQNNNIDFVSLISEHLAILDNNVKKYS